ncbi:MAG: hypothetical protein ACTSRA_12635 [Promethearchaeota archaeon]
MTLHHLSPKTPIFYFSGPAREILKRDRDTTKTLEKSKNLIIMQKHDLSDKLIIIMKNQERGKILGLPRHEIARKRS